MEKHVIDRFHQILALMPMQDLCPLYDEIMRLHKEGQTPQQIAWRFIGAVTYVYECRVNNRDPETGRKVPNDLQHF